MKMLDWLWDSLMSQRHTNADPHVHRGTWTVIWIKFRTLIKKRKFKFKPFNTIHAKYGNIKTAFVFMRIYVQYKCLCECAAQGAVCRVASQRPVPNQSRHLPADRLEIEAVRVRSINSITQPRQTRCTLHTYVHTVCHLCPQWLSQMKTTQNMRVALRMHVMLAWCASACS